MTETGTSGDPLFRRWTDLCHRLDLDGSGEWDTLVSHYGESGRAYHNLSHIADCLRQMDDHAEVALDANALEMAIWFHDVIYDPRSSGNEIGSAEHAEAFLGGTSLGPSVRKLILATRHSDEPLERDAALMVDIDLSILGAEPSIYQRYAAAIRAEYSFVPQDQYVAGRTKVLSGFLERPHLFTNECFQRPLESIARANLAAEIESLRASG